MQPNASAPSSVPTIKTLQSACGPASMHCRGSYPSAGEKNARRSAKPANNDGSNARPSRYHPNSMGAPIRWCARQSNPAT